MSDQADESFAVVEVFDDRNPETRIRLEELRSTPGVAFLDSVDQQLSAVGELIPPLGDEIVGEPARWIYFPWRKAAIRLLGPAGYRRLRLDRNRNKLTVAEQDRAGQLKVGVVGLSVGHAVAHTLALEGLCGQLRLTDFDHIELSNLNRVPGSVFDIGINKAVVAARRIAEIDPYLDVRVHEEGVQESTIDAFLDGLDVVIEECDSFDAKVLVRDRARALGIPVIMETSDGGVLDVERFDLEPGRPLFHGLLGDFNAETLAGLSAAEKVPFALQILDGDKLTSRMAASVFEMGRTLSAWPQLGGDVALGGATVAAAVRRIVRGEALPSGRVRVDLDSILDELTEPEAVSVSAERTTVDVRAEFSRLESRDAVLYAGSRAPSLGNAQPWRFDVDDAGVTVRPDVASLSTIDVGGRGTAVALGAVLHNMTIAASATGVFGRAAITGTGHGISGRLEFGSGADVDKARQLDAMLGRRTNRGFGDRSELGADVVSGLDGIGTDVARARLVTDPQILAGFGAIAGAAERLRYLDSNLQSEMMAEIVAAADPASDTGIEVGDMALMPQQAPLLALLRRPDVMAHLDSWGVGSALGADAQGRVMTSSALAVITVDDRSAASYMHGGMVMEDFWIRAQAAGLAVQPITPAFLYAEGIEECTAVSTKGAELFELARQFDELFDVEDGQAVAAVLRLSRTPFVPSVSRRRVVI